MSDLILFLMFAIMIGTPWVGFLILWGIIRSFDKAIAVSTDINPPTRPKKRQNSRKIKGKRRTTSKT